jgi:endonuclease YncB( thermonuclease family)
MTNRTCIVAVALFAGLVTNVAAQEIRPGYSPDRTLPTVSLPQRTQTVQQTSIQRPDSEVSTAVTRNGATRTTTDLKKAPPGALQAAAASSRASATAQTATSTETKKKYSAGMVLYGKARAYDGHSLIVDGNPVRLNGIEAPGLAQTCSTSARTSWKCGQKAFDRLVELVGTGMVRCTVVAPAGYGAAATCSAAQAKDIGALLVSEGFALPNRQSAGTYNSAALAAMNSRRGLWIGPFTDPAKWRLEHR